MNFFKLTSILAIFVVFVGNTGVVDARRIKNRRSIGTIKGQSANRIKKLKLNMRIQHRSTVWDLVLNIIGISFESNLLDGYYFSPALVMIHY